MAVEHDCPGARSIHSICIGLLNLETLPLGHQFNLLHQMISHVYLDLLMLTARLRQNFHVDLGLTHVCLQSKPLQNCVKVIYLRSWHVANTRLLCCLCLFMCSEFWCNKTALLI